MQLNPLHPVLMVRAREGLQQLAEDTNESPLVRKLAQKLVRHLPGRTTPHHFATQALTYGHQIYAQRCASQEERNALLAQHIPALARRVCPPDFAATVEIMYRTY